MTSPYNYDSDWDWYDSLLTPLQRQLNEILSDDPVYYLEERRLTEDFFNTYFNEIMDFCVDREFVSEYIEGYLKNQEI